MALPPNLKFGTVTGQYLITAPDGADVDTLPDAVPASGTVTFTPSAGVIYSYDETNPVALAKDSIVCPLDSEGYICTPGTTTRGVKLLATDDETLRPVGWQWIVTYQLRDQQDRLIHDFQRMPLEVPADVPTNLIKAAPIAQSNGAYITKGDKGDTGTVTPELQALVGQAAASESNAAGSASTAATQAGLASSAKADAEAARNQAQALHSSTVISGTVNESGRLVLTRNDSTVVDAGSVVGPTGPVGPATTLSVLETTTGVDYQYPGPVGPKGDKGDPGGIVLGTSTGTNNLNTITASGLYRQDNSANATLANNYPVVAPGVLTVYERVAGTSLVQNYQTITGTLSYEARVFYTRVLQGGVWSPWRAYASSRVDQTAGRVVYQWDDVNNREQIIYGDTGWRNLIANLSAPMVGATASPLFNIRRMGSTVTLSARVSPASATVGTGRTILVELLNAIPVGFVPSSSVAYTTLGSGCVDTPSKAIVQVGNYSLINQLHMYTSTGTWAANEVAMFTARWETNDAWPTTLPGTASGTIPNA